jgi:flagellar biosynthesis GTPase FlhF
MVGGNSRQKAGGEDKQMSRSRIKQIKAIMWFGAVLFALAIAARASAQFGMPQVPGFSSYYPWFNDVPQYQGDQSFRWFLANHPNIARALARNPELLYNANWRRQHPPLEQYLEYHPYVWQALNNEYWCTGPAETQWGDYDDQHQWRDAYWWHQNNPDWFYNNHQDWVSLNPRWRDRDGDYDQQHVWHYGQWWYTQDPNWVKTRHPDWLRQHQNWTTQATQQQNQQQGQQRQALREQQQRNLQQQQAAHRQNQQNQQQDQQHQALREQQQRNLQQQQAAHQQNQQNQRQQAEQKQKPQQATTHQEHQQQPQGQQQNKQHEKGNDKP